MTLPIRFLIAVFIPALCGAGTRLLSHGHRQSHQVHVVEVVPNQGQNPTISLAQTTDYLEVFRAAQNTLQEPSVELLPLLDAALLLPPLETIAWRDAIVQHLVSQRSCRELLQTCLRLRYHPVGIIGSDILNEAVILRCIKHDAIPILEALRRELVRPNQVEVLEQVELALSSLRPEISVVAHVLRSHEDASPSEVHSSLMGLLNATLKTFPLPKWQRVTLMQASAKYFGPQKLWELAATLENADDRRSFLHQIALQTSPSEAKSRLEQIQSIPGWERQSEVLATLVGKWALITSSDDVRTWILENTAATSQFESLRQLRNSLLAKGDTKNAIDMINELKQEYGDREFDADISPIQSRELRISILHSLNSHESLRLLQTWDLGEKELESMLADDDLPADVSGVLQARLVVQRATSIDDWKEAFVAVSRLEDLHQLGPLTLMVASEHDDIAVDILNALPADSLAHEVLSIALGANTYRAIGKSLFISGEGTGHLRHDQMPDAAAAVAFTEWINESRAESSQWLLENVDSNTNQHLIEALIERIRVDDRDSAMAWSMLLSDESKKAHYEQSLQIYDDSN